MYRDEVCNVEVELVARGSFKTGIAVIVSKSVEHTGCNTGVINEEISLY